MQKVQKKIQRAKPMQGALKTEINARDKQLQRVSHQQDKGLCGCGVQCGTASLFCTQSIVSLRITSFPGHTPTKKSGLVFTVCTCM